MVRTQIQLTEQQARALKQLATAQDVSVAELIRQGVEHILTQRQVVSQEERRRRAILVSGRFRSDVHDLGSDHDRYLAEAYRHDLH